MSDTAGYTTSDLHLAAFLRVSGLRLRDVRLNGGSRAVFVFEDAPERAGLVAQYRNQEGSVEPVRYVEVWKSLKAQIGTY